MPDCPYCTAELEDDVLVGMLWCWRCRQHWRLADGLLFDPDRPTLRLVPTPGPSAGV